MKVFLNMDGSLAPLYRHIELEGDSVTKFKKEADLILSDPIELVKLASEKFQVTEQSGVTDFFITRYFNHEVWTAQLIIGIPIFGLMNNNLGPKVCTGSGLRYIKDDHKIWDGKFNEYTLALKELRTKDFVTLRFDNAGTLLGVQTGIPFYGLFAVMEGVRGKLSEWFCQPDRLYESWVVSLLITNSPFPNPIRNISGIYPILKVTAGIEKHFWLFPADQVRHEEFVPRSNILGIATAWAGIEDDTLRAQQGTLARAAGFALKTASSIDCPEKQYRTDLADRVQEQWVRMKSLGIV